MSKIRSIQKYLTGINKHIKTNIYKEYRKVSGKGYVNNDIDRIHLANSIFLFADKLECRFVTKHKSEEHPQIEILFDAINRVYDDLPESCLDYVNP